MSWQKPYDPSPQKASGVNLSFTLTYMFYILIDIIYSMSLIYRRFFKEMHWNSVKQKKSEKIKIVYMYLSNWQMDRKTDGWPCNKTHHRGHDAQIVNMICAPVFAWGLWPAPAIFSDCNKVKGQVNKVSFSLSFPHLNVWSCRVSWRWHVQFLRY